MKHTVPFHEVERTKLSNNCLSCINQSQCFSHMILTQTILLNINLVEDLLKSELGILEGKGENTGNPVVLQPASDQHVLQLLHSSLLPANILQINVRSGLTNLLLKPIN